MQVEIPDDLIKRVVKAANWRFGKDTPEIQVGGALAIFCEETETWRKKEEAELNEKIRAMKATGTTKIPEGTDGINQGT